MCLERRSRDRSRARLAVDLFSESPTMIEFCHCQPEPRKGRMVNTHVALVSIVLVALGAGCFWAADEGLWIGRHPSSTQPQQEVEAWMPLQAVVVVWTGVTGGSRSAKGWRGGRCRRPANATPSSPWLTGAPHYADPGGAADTGNGPVHSTVAHPAARGRLGAGAGDSVVVHAGPRQRIPD